MRAHPHATPATTSPHQTCGCCEHPTNTPRAHPNGTPLCPGCHARITAREHAHRTFLQRAATLLDHWLQECRAAGLTDLDIREVYHAARAAFATHPQRPKQHHNN